jgi:uncharacterized protein YkuJ
MKHLLESKTPLTFTRKCAGCRANEEFEIPEVGKTSIIKIEHRFEYNGLKIADIAYLDEGELLCIFEIYNTHKTESDNRPNCEWFEIDAKTLIKLANDTTLTLDKPITIPCMRCEKCEGCVEKENTIVLANQQNKKRAKNILCGWIEQTIDDGDCGGIYPLYFTDYCGFVSRYDDNWKDIDDDNYTDLDTYLKSSSSGMGNNVDILFTNKSNDRYGINLTDVVYNPEKLKELNDYGIGIYNIDFNWILQQKTLPNELVCVRIIDE